MAGQAHEQEDDGDEAKDQAKTEKKKAGVDEHPSVQIVSLPYINNFS